MPAQCRQQLLAVLRIEAWLAVLQINRNDGTRLHVVSVGHETKKRGLLRYVGHETKKRGLLRGNQSSLSLLPFQIRENLRVRTFVGALFRFALLFALFRHDF